jgi:hydrogenase expression/formation protein HypE
VEEAQFPVTESVQSVADILGLNPLEVANEGVIVAVVSKGEGRRTVDLLKNHEAGIQASIVGSISELHPGTVVLSTLIGGRRILDFPRGLLLPRIC